MKNYFFKILSVMMALMMLTSCDEDTMISNDLDGQWEGNFGAYYTIQGRDGSMITYYAYNTVIEFYKKGFRNKGYGMEIDFYDRGPSPRIYNEFSWEVKDEVIYMYYDRDSFYDDLVINSYKISREGLFFTGFFGDSNERFTLRKYSDAHDGECFVWDTYGYARARTIDREDVPSPIAPEYVATESIKGGHSLKR